jgi:hypothetical protein
VFYPPLLDLVSIGIVCVCAVVEGNTKNVIL